MHAWKAGGNCQCASVILGFFNWLPQHLLYWNNTNVYLFRSCLFRFRLPQMLNSSRESSSCTELLLLSLLVLPQPNFVRSLTAGKNMDSEWRLTCLLPNETPFLSPIARGHLALLWVLPSSFQLCCVLTKSPFCLLQILLLLWHVIARILSK